MTHQIPAYATSELLRLELEIAEHEQAIARKNEQRREIINRYSMNKPPSMDGVVRSAYAEMARRKFTVEGVCALCHGLGEVSDWSMKVGCSTAVPKKPCPQCRPGIQK